MKTVKLILTYIVAGAATALGWKITETLIDPFKRTVLKQKIKNVKNAIQK